MTTRETTIKGTFDCAWCGKLRNRVYPVQPCERLKAPDGGYAVYLVRKDNEGSPELTSGPYKTHTEAREGADMFYPDLEWSQFSL